jgi:hypothetical protein
MNVFTKARLWPWLLVAAIASAGCASTPPEMEDISEASGNVVFSLVGGMLIRDGSQSVHLASGNYRIVKKNSYGSMLAAPGFGVIRSSSRGYFGYQGGVWMPRNRGANAKIYVLHETSERQYQSLESALTLPADAERKMLEMESKNGSGSKNPLDTTTSGSSQPFEYGNPAYSPVATVVMALIESQRGKPDVIAEISQAEFEKLLEPSMRSVDP